MSMQSDNANVEEESDLEPGRTESEDESLISDLEMDDTASVPEIKYIPKFRGKKPLTMFKSTPSVPTREFPRLEFRAVRDMAYRDRHTAPEAKDVNDVMGKAYKRAVPENVADTFDAVAIRVTDEEYAVYNAYVASHKDEIDRIVGETRERESEEDEAIRAASNQRPENLRKGTWADATLQEVRAMAHLNPHALRAEGQEHTPLTEGQAGDTECLEEERAETRDTAM